MGQNIFSRACRDSGVRHDDCEKTPQAVDAEALRSTGTADCVTAAPGRSVEDVRPFAASKFVENDRVFVEHQFIGVLQICCHKDRRAATTYDRFPQTSWHAIYKQAGNPPVF